MKRRWMVFSGLILLWIFLSGQATLYKRFAYDRIGFYSSQVDDDIYRVSFSAPEEETFRKLSDFVLLCCAEMTLEAGYRYFVVKENYYNADSYGVGLREKNFSNKDKTRYNEIFKGYLRKTLTYVIQCFEDIPDEKTSTIYDAAVTVKQIKKAYGIKK